MFFFNPFILVLRGFLGFLFHVSQTFDEQLISVKLWFSIYCLLKIFGLSLPFLLFFILKVYFLLYSSDPVVQNAIEYIFSCEL